MSLIRALKVNSEPTNAITFLSEDEFNSTMAMQDLVVRGEHGYLLGQTRHLSILGSYLYGKLSPDFEPDDTTTVIPRACWRVTTIQVQSQVGGENAKYIDRPVYYKGVKVGLVISVSNNEQSVLTIMHEQDYMGTVEYKDLHLAVFSNRIVLIDYVRDIPVSLTMVAGNLPKEQDLSRLGYGSIVMHKDIEVGMIDGFFDHGRIGILIELSGLNDADKLTATNALYSGITLKVVKDRVHLT